MAERPLRADAVQNRRRILAAARDVFIEHGPAAPLDEVARRAGTGIATLYRRFPDRQELIRAVVVDALEEAVAVMRSAAAEEPDPFAVLRRYVHGALDSRVAAVLPALLDAIPTDDPEMAAGSTTGAALLEEMVRAAHEAGRLRPDVSVADIGTLVVRLSRPLPGNVAPEVDVELAHRHADLVFDGLHAGADPTTPLAGAAMSFPELRRAADRKADKTPNNNAEPPG